MKQELTELIEAERARFRVPGVAVGVIRGGDVLLAVTVGEQEAGTGQMVTERTQFAIGSCTKAMTSYALSTLADERALGWIQPVREYLPEFRLADEMATTHTTIVDLLAHRTGVPRHDLAWYGRPELTREDAVAALRYLEPSCAFRQAWQYNNLMYVAAGRVAESVATTTWEDIVTARVVTALGMTDTNLSVYDMAQSTEPSTGHRLGDDGGGAQARPVPYCPLDSVTPAGAVNSSLSDMLRWLEFAMYRAPERLRAPAMAMPVSTAREEHRDIWPEVRTTAYALGWFLGCYRGHDMVYHAGNIDGFAAMTSFLPGLGAGVVILSNLGETPLPVALTYSIYDRLLGKTDKNWGERFEDLDRATAAGRDQVVADRAATARHEPPSHPVPAHCGTYRHPGYGTVAIRERKGNLTATLNGMPLEFRHRHYDVWEAYAPIAPLGMPASFQTSFAGDVDRMTIALEPAVPPIGFGREAHEPRSPWPQLRVDGTYRLGPLSLRIDTGRDGSLQLSLSGSPVRLAERVGAHVYRMVGLPAGHIRFAVSGDQVLSVLSDPWGRFQPARPE